MADGGAKELRLAVVCYGGVSLAIYMHGITKELHKLVRASRAFDECWQGDDTANPFENSPAADSEYAYFEELRDLAKQGDRLSVSIDIIAGTSAGGINGVCLAKALAHNGDQQSLKSLWINEGDLARLIDAPHIGGWRGEAVLAAIRTLTYPMSVRFPLLGRRMSWLLFDAILAMEGPAGQTLVPDTGSLDLYVTTTDLNGFDVLVPSGAGGVSQRDSDHAQVLRFRYEKDKGDDYTVADTGSLAFAARATSCFPGAFAPVSLHSFQTEIDSGGKHRDLNPDQLVPRFQRPYSEARNPVDDAWFVDGGVLDNAPFDLVVDAIAQKRAETEVLRRLIYIEPDPGLSLKLPSQNPPARAPVTGAAPGWLQSLWTALATVKGSHSFLRDLQRLRDLNLRIGEVSEITSAQMAHVLDTLNSAAAAVQQQTPWEEMNLAHVKDLAGKLYQEAQDLIGAYYPTYCRLKFEAACSALADEISVLFSYPPDSTHQSFTRAVLSAWGNQRLDWNEATLAAIGTLLGPADMPYRERRLLFILAGVNDLYQHAGLGGAPTASDLNELKKRAWTMLDAVRGAPTQAAAEVDHGLTTFLSAEQLRNDVFSSPEAFASAHSDALGVLFDAYSSELGKVLADGSGAMWDDFQAFTARWDGAYRRSLLSRYVGFPLWDALIFPTIALSDLPQFTPIGVAQYSPVAAAALTPPDDPQDNPRQLGGQQGNQSPRQHKLRGTAWHHFGGFMDAGWRQNDYLWGRLDGAELVLRTVRDVARPRDRHPATAARLSREQAIAAAGPRLKEAITRILSAESDLGLTATLRDGVSAQMSSAPWT